MYNYFFGAKENASKEALSKSRSSGLTGHSPKTKASKTKKIETKEKNMVSPMSSFNDCSVDQLESLDPGQAKARAFKNKLNSKMNLESLDPNNMEPLCNGNERLTACKVCARNFSPQRIGTHQSICQRMAKREAKNEHKAKHFASNTPMDAKARQKLVRAYSPNPTSSVRKQSHTVPPPSKTIPNVGKPRPMTAKPDLEDFPFNKEQCNKKKRPLSAALPCLLPNFFTRQKVEADDRIACPTCQRKFNKDSAERHIPFCAQQAAIVRPAKASPRRKYVVPKLKRFATDAPIKPQKLKQESDVSSTYPVMPFKQEINKHRRARSKAGPARTESPVSHTRTSNRPQLTEAALKPSGSQRSGTRPNESAEASNRRRLPASELKPTGSQRSGTQGKGLPEQHSTDSSMRRQLPVLKLRPLGPGRSEVQPKSIPEPQLQNTPKGHPLPAAELKPTGPESYGAMVMGLPQTRPGRSEAQAKSIPERQLQNKSKGRTLLAAELKPTAPERCSSPVMDLTQTQARNMPGRRQSPVIESQPAGSDGTHTAGRPQTQSEKRHISSYSNSNKSPNVLTSNYSTVQRQW